MRPDLQQAVFKLLRDVERRPGMFLGSDSPRDQLRNLQWLLVGFQLGFCEASNEARDGFLAAFADYLRSQHGTSAAAGPIAAVLSMTSDDREAWSIFWNAVHAFERTFASHD